MRFISYSPTVCPLTTFLYVCTIGRLTVEYVDTGNVYVPTQYIVSIRKKKKKKDYDDEAYAQTLADSDTCDNSSFLCGTEEPATYTIVVERFDKGSEEIYDAMYRACAACNRACKRSFLGDKIKSHHFNNSTRAVVKARRIIKDNDSGKATVLGHAPHAPNSRAPSPACDACNPDPSEIMAALQDSLRILNG